jgi:16S rRNA (guanine527-N7)-methyltransferase
VLLAKGSSLPEEIEEAQGAMAELKCSLVATELARPTISSTLVFATFRKSGTTPEKYPRRPGVPGKRPLQNS